MKCVVVYNPKSGSALSAAQIRQKFSDASIDIDALIPLTKNTRRRLAHYIHRGETIAVIGGDGTVGSVASQLVGTKATILALPGGTLNHFVKDLGLHTDIDEVLKNLSDTTVRHIDIASVNGHYFLNNSSIGLYPHSLQTRDRLEDTFGKWPAAILGCLRALVAFHHYHLSLNGQAITTPFVFVGNNNYKMNDFAATNRSRIDEGILYVATVIGSTRWQLMKIFGRMLTGRLHAANDFSTYTTKKEIKIETRRRYLRVSRDGELEKLATPVIYTVHPAALRVIVPK